jgi:hypothetical protein
MDASTVPSSPERGRKWEAGVLLGLEAMVAETTSGRQLKRMQLHEGFSMGLLQLDSSY